jgi:hypothetical protein
MATKYCLVKLSKSLDVGFGTPVIYVPMHLPIGSNLDILTLGDHGKISSFSKSGKTVFVKFDKDVEKLGWNETTAQGCDADSLYVETLRAVELQQDLLQQDLRNLHGL